MGGPLLAPRWHTAAMVAWLLAVPTFALLLGAPTTTQSFQQACVSLLVLEWSWVVATWVGLRFHRATLIDLTGSPRLGDMPWGIAACALILLVEAVWPSGGARRFVASEPVEHVLWAAVALSAAFAEELVFRGYLQRQFSALLGSVAAGVLAQAVVFGLIHGDQGGLAVIHIGLYGLGFGVLARVRGTLWAGIVGHLAVNLLSGWMR